MASQLLEGDRPVAVRGRVFFLETVDNLGQLAVNYQSEKENGIELSNLLNFNKRNQS